MRKKSVNEDVLYILTTIFNAKSMGIAKVRTRFDTKQINKLIAKELLVCYNDRYYVTPEGAELL